MNNSELRKYCAIIVLKSANVTTQGYAESLRLLLITTQAYLLAWMLATGLWRRLPMWCAWLTAEMVSRAIFSAIGGYWHHLWLPLQPVILFLLVCAAIEARWHADSMDLPVIATAAIIVAPVGIFLNLPEMISFRVLINAALVPALIGCHGTPTVRWHAVIMATLAAGTAALGWMPATGTSWWRMRVAYLVLALVCCGGWIALFSRRAHPDDSSV